MEITTKSTLKESLHGEHDCNVTLINSKGMRDFNEFTAAPGSIVSMQKQASCVLSHRFVDSNTNCIESESNLINASGSSRRYFH